MIAIIDYGMGNLRSVQKAIEVAGARAKVTSNPKDLEKAEKIVFPGVGAFGEAMAELRRRRLADPIAAALGKGKPFLGLCLGLQLLFEKSEEAPGVKGLSILKGKSKRFNFSGSALGEMGSLKVPHMGWNTISGRPLHITGRPAILRGVPDGTYVYFVHSYYVIPEDMNIVLTTTRYGISFVSGIWKDNIYAFQFHPEKSQSVGLKVLRNFVRL